jgi:hypothetical protein
MTYCGWASEILHHQFGMVETQNHGMFTIYQLVISLAHPSTTVSVVCFGLDVVHARHACLGSSSIFEVMESQGKS